MPDPDTYLEPEPEPVPGMVLDADLLRHHKERKVKIKKLAYGMGDIWQLQFQFQLYSALLG